LSPAAANSSNRGETETKQGAREEKPKEKQQFLGGRKQGPAGEKYYIRGGTFFREKKESWKDFVLKKKEEGNRERESPTVFF
jgi:hypothetical protein